MCGCPVRLPIEQDATSLHFYCVLGPKEEVWGDCSADGSVIRRYLLGLPIRALLSCYASGRERRGTGSLGPVSSSAV